MRAFDVDADDGTLFVVPAPYGLWGAMQHSGSLIAVGDDGSGCSGTGIDFTVFDTSKHFVALASAAESDFTVSGLPPHLFAIGIQDEGAGVRVSDGLVDGDGKVIRASDSSEFSSLIATSTAHVLAPAGEGRSFLFSRRASGVFSVGGYNGDGPLGVWFQALGGGVKQIPLEEPPGTSLAATFAWGDDQLYVIDDVTLESGRRIGRGYRVPRFGGTLEFFAWNDRHDEQSIFMTVDRDGGVLVASTGAKHFSLFHLTWTAEGPLAHRYRSERGRLLRAPIIDGKGYSFVIEDEGAVRITRRTRLSAVDCGDDATFDEGQAPPGKVPAPDCDPAWIGAQF